MAEEPSGVNVVSPKIRDQALVRKFVSQYGSGYVGINVVKGQESVNVDDGTMNLKVYYRDPTEEFPSTSDPRGELVLDVSSGFGHPETGKYDYDIGPENTANRGVLTAEWTYEVNGVELKFVDHLQILNQMPYYDTLDPERRAIVEQVSWMFGDLYDSAEGGPHLIDEFQTKFDFERISRLMGRALTRMNTTGFPIQNWNFGPPFSDPTSASYPPSEFSGLLVIGTYLEVIRHLRDSYVEIPARPNMNVTYVDRRDYWQRWSQVLAQEYPEWQRMVKMAKRKMLNLGRGSLLVSGGIYGGSAGGIFMSGTYASQTRAFRFYPAAPSLAFNSTLGRFY